MTKIGVYPGTFDPMTNGHLNIIKRSLKKARVGLYSILTGLQAISDESDIIANGSNINIVRSNDGYVRVVSAE